MQILGFGTYDIRSHPRVGILLDGLREAGHDVVEINVPLGLSTADRVSMLRQPWRLPQLALRLLRCWLTLLRAARRDRPRPDVVIVGYLGHFDVLLARRLFPAATLVLDQLVFAGDTAADRGVTGGLRSRLLDRLDAAACAAADLIVVDTAENAALVPRQYSSRCVSVSVGAAMSWFVDRAHPAGSVSGPLQVVFYGLFTPLQGAITIAAAGALLDPARVQLTMIGAGQDLAQARLAAGTSGVRWVSWVPPENLPSLVGGADVCLGIAGTTPKAQRVVPNKVFQGAAAGCAIVTSDTAPQRRQLQGAALFVPPGDPVALAGALHELAGDRAQVSRLGAAARRLAQAQFTPLAVTAPLRTALAAHHPQGVAP
ncbi:MAG TPA: glycosyltransferase [Mycobacteriales bacterium]|jgi:glycosyltransferase involved in cell wall biosynthesis|nr:glycosyltransferase [Mycobacteriales bacterium]